LTGDAMNKFRDVVSRMQEITPGDIYYADFHNLFAEAWDLVVELNTMIVKMPPPLTQVYVEDWGYGGLERMGKVFHEDWGYQEPPEMVQVFKEEWSG